MKVVEKDTDRQAEVHVCVEGTVNALPEYGEYVDSRDKAICCYVPVEEGHRVKFGGRFSGTVSTASLSLFQSQLRCLSQTMVITYDAVVDGVYRRASSYNAKTVHYQKNKRLNVDNFLYNHEGDVIDTNMHVARLSGVKMTQKAGPAAIGTMELRVCITRQHEVTHAIGDVIKYDSAEDTLKGVAVFHSQIKPTLEMTFEKNSAPLDRVIAAREQRKINSERPGKESWAIFRFHYRSNGMLPTL